jgi:hypothetical protein
MNRRYLAWPPYQRGHRERAVRLDVQDVAAVAVLVASPLFIGQDLRTWQVPAKLAGDQLGCPLPVGMLLGGSPDAGDQVSRTPGTNRHDYRHA